jgi:hypothetical protein
MGFQLSTYGCQSTKITDAAGGTATVHHRPVPLGWRTEHDAITSRLLRAMPDAPARPEGDDPPQDEVDAYSVAAEAYTATMQRLDRDMRADLVALFRRMLLDVVIEFDGITINNEPAKVEDVISALARAGGDHDMGDPLITLGRAVLGSSRIGPEVEKD